MHPKQVFLRHISAFLVENKKKYRDKGVRVGAKMGWSLELEVRRFYGRDAGLLEEPCARSFE